MNLDGTSLTERVVLLTLVREQRRGAESVTSAEIESACQDCLDDVDAEVVGRLTEADVTRALNALAAESLVEEAMAKRSPVGKGRPSYTLDADPEATVEALSTDDRLAPLVDAVR
jgi:hypothetical protein